MKKETKSKLIRACVLLPIVIAVTWYMFTHIYIYPKIELWRNGNRSNVTLIKVEEGYEFAQDAYSIENTDIGYDVIIHLTHK